LQRLPKAMLVYWLPWSLWWMTSRGLALLQRHVQRR
jgi:hypothetical protein